MTAPGRSPVTAGAARPTMDVRGVRLRADPARESCFQVVHLHHEMWRSVGFSPTGQRETLHREFNTEVQGMEIAAQSLVDFPDAPWALRMEIARQCWDESRHARLYLGRLRDKGGHPGEFPIANHEWSVTCVFDTLVERLTIQNRTFESGSMDSMRKAVTRWQDTGDPETAELIDGILADEVQHVRYANDWLKRLAAEDPRVVLQVVAAVSEFKRISAELRPRPGDTSINGVDLYRLAHDSVPANVGDRDHASFTLAEIDALVLQQRREAVALLTAPHGGAP
jgi:uncharacterized ferritin-like protein (DUF455 family)